VKLKNKFGLTIGTKLISLITILVLGSLGIVGWLSIHLFIEDNTALIQRMNVDAAASLAGRMKTLFQGLTEKMRMTGDVLLRVPPGPDRENLLTEFFTGDDELLGLFVFEYDSQGNPRLKESDISPEMASIGDKDGEKAKALVLSLALKPSVNANEPDLRRVPNGETQISISKLWGDIPVLVVAIPLGVRKEKNFSYSALALFRETKFTKAFAESDVATLYMVDRYGRLLGHSDAALAAPGDDFSGVDIVRNMLEGKSDSGESSYAVPPTSEARLGAYRLIGFGGLGVVAEVPEAKAFDAAQNVVKRASYVALVVLSLAFLLGYLYSDSISFPIKNLERACRAIAEGNFDVFIRTRNRDEVGDLSSTFNEMVKGLVERQRVKETFSKFNDNEIVDKLLSGEITLAGETRRATMFYSDIHSFDSLVESMKPEEIVELTNEYLTRMVAVIGDYGGVVDKFVGNAITAFWGAPLESEDDTRNAVNACLAVRSEVAKLNELRISRGQPALQIGIGLNVGAVIAGNMGSKKRMEYTVIGDTIGAASRIESMTRRFGTDLLVSVSVFEKVKDYFIFENVKGFVEVFKVIGYIDDKGQEVRIETEYSSYEPEQHGGAVPRAREKKVAAG
jgi:adenylate cyclase